MNSPRTTLYRDKHNAKLMGVCAGIADYTGVNVFWVRMAAFLSICWWAYKPSNRQRFEDNGRLPLDTDPLSPPPADQNARGDEK